MFIPSNISCTNDKSSLALPISSFTTIISFESFYSLAFPFNSLYLYSTIEKPYGIKIKPNEDGKKPKIDENIKDKEMKYKDNNFKEELSNSIYC
ncbi:hypothetical protein NMZ80_06600 [Clostridioides difficile]|uniref:hypothetical protein n=1 Tax=Clostridioides difficile TaxID=1496 RepID=UPI0021C2D884|nr:hypothetical protein [Clostridioides difficile]UUC43111.1 hypothetical protein NMZ80_06600 [Clostridioides difficile]